MKNNNDYENLIEKLSPQASLPSLAFENKLRKKLLLKNKGPLLKRMQNSFDNIFFGMGGIPFNHFGVLTAMVLVVGIMMSGLIVWNINQQETVIEQVAQISAQETYAVLRSVYLNNPSALLSANSQTGLLTEMLTSNNESKIPTLNSFINTETKDFNFFHVTYKSSVGPLASICNTFQTDNTILDTYLYENKVNDSLSEYYFKSVLTDNTGLLKKSVITDNVGTLIYEGGEFAYPLIEKDLQTEDTTQLEISNIFGENSKLQKIEIDGKEYYEVIMIQDIDDEDFCVVDDGQPRQLIIVNRIDPDNDYQIIETSYYLDIIESEHLILKTENTYEKMFIEAEDALINYFTLPEGVTLEQ